MLHGSGASSQTMVWVVSRIGPDWTDGPEMTQIRASGPVISARIDQLLLLTTPKYFESTPTANYYNYYAEELLGMTL